MSSDLILNNGRERRDLGGTPQISAETKKLVGYAARFYDPSDPSTEYRYKAYRKDGSVVEIRERILPGAFDAALRDDETRGMYNHRSLLGNRVPGRDKNTLELRTDDKGLWYEVDLAETTSGRDVKISLERGDITGSSFVFTAREGGIVARQEGEYIVRELRSLHLHDVSAVDYPAYAGTSAELRSAHAPSDLVELLSQAKTPEVRSADPVVDPANLQELQQFAAFLDRPEQRGTDAISQSEIQYQLAQLLETSLDSWVWPSEVYDTFCIYSFGNQEWKQDYTVTGYTVSLVGRPIPGKCVDTFVPNAG